MKYKLNLQQFAEGEEAAAIPETAGAETATAAESTTEPLQVSAGDTLANGQVVSSQVAAEMNRQMAKHPELRKTYGQGLKQGQRNRQAAEAPVPGNPPEEKSIEDRWEELKKGEFAELYGRDVQGAVQDRFKNQRDVSEKLKALDPMLAVLRERAGVQTDEELIHHVMDDDSLYEDAANEAGMTVDAYKQFLELKQERDEAQQTIENQNRERHFMKLWQQAQEFKKQLPDFDLMKELETDPRFFRLTSEEVGLDVQSAFFALHKDEMMPQAMQAGMDRAKQQMGQTIQAQHKRPVEGAMKSRGQAAADFNIDPRTLSLPERKRVYDLIHKGLMKWG